MLLQRSAVRAGSRASTRPAVIAGLRSTNVVRSIGVAGKQTNLRVAFVSHPRSSSLRTAAQSTVSITAVANLLKDTSTPIVVYGAQGATAVRVAKFLLEKGAKVTAVADFPEAAKETLAFAKKYELLDSAALARLKIVDAQDALPARSKVIIVEGDEIAGKRTDGRYVEAAIKAAAESGVGQIILVTGPSAGGSGFFGGGSSSGANKALSRTEQLLASTGVPSVVLRAVAADKATGKSVSVVPGPGTLAVAAAPLTNDQLSEVLADLLAQPAPPAGATIVLEAAATGAVTDPVNAVYGKSLAEARAKAPPPPPAPAAEKPKLSPIALGTISMRKVLSDDEDVKPVAKAAAKPATDAKPAGTGLFGGLFGTGTTSGTQAKKAPAPAPVAAVKKAPAPPPVVVKKAAVKADDEEDEKPKGGSGIFGWFAVNPDAPKKEAAPAPKPVARSAPPPPPKPAPKPAPAPVVVKKAPPPPPPAPVRRPPPPPPAPVVVKKAPSPPPAPVRKPLPPPPTPVKKAVAQSVAVEKPKSGGGIFGWFAVNPEAPKKDEAPAKAAPKPVAKAPVPPPKPVVKAPVKPAPVSSRNRSPEPEDSKASKPSGLAALFGWGAKPVDTEDDAPPARKAAPVPSRPASAPATVKKAVPPPPPARTVSGTQRTGTQAAKPATQATQKVVAKPGTQASKPGTQSTSGTGTIKGTYRPVSGFSVAPKKAK